MRVKYVRYATSQNRKRPQPPGPKWLLMGAVISALIAGIFVLIGPAIIVLFSVISGILAIWGVSLWIWQRFR